MKQGVELHNLSWNVNQSSKTNQNKWVLLPDVSAKLEFAKSRKLSFKYRIRTSLQDSSQFANRYFLRSYNSVFRGNQDLENNLFHSANLNYRRFSLYRGVMFFANASYLKQIQQARNSVGFVNENQFLTSVMFQNPLEQTRFNLNLEKKIKKLRYILRANTTFTKYTQEINSVLERFKDNDYSVTLGVETIFKKWPNFEIGFTRSIGEFKTNSYTKFVTNEPYLNIDYDFLDGFVFSFEYSLYDYRNIALQQKNTYDLANLNLSYQKEDSAWVYKVVANNLFNTKFKQSNRFSTYLISDKKTFILPRAVMFSLSYKL